MNKFLVFLLNTEPIAFTILTVSCCCLGLVGSLLNVQANTLGVITCVFSTFGGAIIGAILFLMYQKFVEYLFDIW